MNGIYLSANDVSQLLGCSRGNAYKIVKNLNTSLEKNGYIVVAGKIPKKYFAEKYYGVSLDDIQAALA